MKRLDCQLMQDTHTSPSSTAPAKKGDIRPRPLPGLPIAGDIVYFLDDLLEIAVRDLGRDPKEVMADVVSRGLASFVASIPEADRKRLGLDATHFLTEAAPTQHSAVPPSSTDAGTERDDALSNLEVIKRRIESELQEERKKSRQLAETIRELRLELEDQEVELQPQNLSNGAYESTYTELTHHAFQGKKPAQNTPNGKRPQAAPKKTNKKKRRKGGEQWGKGTPRNQR